jgi:hypothetical protein
VSRSRGLGLSPQHTGLTLSIMAAQLSRGLWVVVSSDPSCSLKQQWPSQRKSEESVYRLPVRGL